MVDTRNHLCYYNIRRKESDYKTFERDFKKIKKGY